MARLTFSPLIAGMSGKTADAVCASWKGRSYVRKRVIPANPNTAAQQTVRESMGRLSPVWRSLESQIKAVQDDYAVNDALSGWNWFTSQNRVLEQTYDTDVITPPNRDIDFVTGITLTDLGGGSLKVDWTGGTTGADYYIYVLARRTTAANELNSFAVISKDTTLVSVGTETIPIAASQDFKVVVIVEEATPGLFSAPVSDDVSMGA